MWINQKSHAPGGWENGTNVSQASLALSPKAEEMETYDPTIPLLSV